jgi:hypothetical protein
MYTPTKKQKKKKKKKKKKALAHCSSFGLTLTHFLTLLTILTPEPQSRGAAGALGRRARGPAGEL